MVSLFSFCNFCFFIRLDKSLNIVFTENFMNAWGTCKLQHKSRFKLGVHWTYFWPIAKYYREIISRRFGEHEPIFCVHREKTWPIFRDMERKISFPIALFFSRKNLKMFRLKNADSMVHWFHYFHIYNFWNTRFVNKCM